MIDESVKRARIFIVDDEPANLKLLDKMLAGQGYENLVLIQNPLEVHDRYMDGRPDLILLDLSMPQLDGFEVIERLKEGLHNPRRSVS